jgi:hypothetical protein
LGRERGEDDDQHRHDAGEPALERQRAALAGHRPGPATGRVATGTTGGIRWAWGAPFETTKRVGSVGGGAPGTPIR